MPILSQRIGFIGSGQMATALTQGFVQAGLTNAETILASDPDANARARFTTNTGGKAVESNLDVVNAADVLFLAVKPQYMASVLQPLSGKIPARTLVISIAAGIKIPQLTGWLGKDVRLVRVMPNTPCFVGQGACGFCSGEKTTPQDVELVKQLLSAVGIAWQVERTADGRRDRFVRLRPSLYLHFDRSDGRCRRAGRIAACDRLGVGRANRSRRRRDGFENARTSGGFKRPRRQSGRNDHCRHQGARRRRFSRDDHRRRRSRNATVAGIGQLEYFSPRMTRIFANIFILKST